MSKARPGASPFPDLNQLSGDLYRQWEKAMGSWWDQVVDSPAFLGAMSKQVGQMAEARGRYEEAVDESLERMHLPTRTDLVRLTRLVTLLEERILSQEDLILSMQDRMESLEREIVRASVEAAEARLEARGQSADPEQSAPVTSETATPKAPRSRKATP